MREAGFDAVAFFSLDVEGAELKVMQTVNPLDFAAILVEFDGHQVDKDFGVHRIMQRAGLFAPFRSMGCRKKHCGGEPQAIDMGGNEVYLSPEVMEEYVNGIVS